MADIPLFFHPHVTKGVENLQLPEDTARHIGQVLRMQSGEAIELTDGKGQKVSAVLDDVSKKRSSIHVVDMMHIASPSPALYLAVAFTKAAARNEWLLEKATELGVRSIIPLITARSVRERIRPERWNAILVSAMLQSKQCWLPVLQAPTQLDSLLGKTATQKLIAHCMDDDPERRPITEALKIGDDATILIGPEGDFTPAELTLAKASGAIPVSLGTNRLRTETAALSVITHYYLTNYAV